jgi:2-polyprenyl-3-methyl-5-hydroxy-6-metoxy-1,4-benzoquinol methylase
MDNESFLKRVVFSGVIVEYDSHELASDIVHAHNLCVDYDVKQVTHDTERLDDRSAIRVFVEDQRLSPDDYDLVTNKLCTRLVIHTPQMSMNRVLFRDFDETVVPNQPLVETD